LWRRQLRHLHQRHRLAELLHGRSEQHDLERLGRRRWCGRLLPDQYRRNGRRRRIGTYVAARLDAQLDQQAVRFLSDRSRNRFRDGRLEVSKIFDWFKEDFEPRTKYFARYAEVLGYPGGDVPIDFLDYDWTLNAYRSSSRR
jgi:hypothetical protein